jgi:lipid-binding SYLF domain-containing protein
MNTAVRRLAVAATALGVTVGVSAVAAGTLGREARPATPASSTRGAESVPLDTGWGSEPPGLIPGI